MAATVSDLTDVVYSGDLRVDALLDAPAVWNFWPDGRKVIYYTFDASAGSLVDQRTQQSVTAFNVAQQQAARQILQHAASVTGIVFSEVASSAQADVHFAAANLSGSATAGLASSFYRYSYRTDGVLTQLNAESLVYLDNVEHAGINNQPVAGSVGYEVLLHEVGHMLGLAHPFDSPRPLPSDQDHTSNTVMSYTSRGSNKTEFQPYDVLALNWIYGRDGLGGAWGVNSVNGPSLALPSSTPVRFVGTALPDLFASTAANEVFEGAGAIDRVNFHGKRADYTLIEKTGSWQVSDAVPGRDGVDTVTQIERLHFADYAVALDLYGAAGTAARLLGAVAGASALGHRDWVGLVLGVVDAGITGKQVAKLALDAVLGATASHAQVVNLVYFNLYHTVPDAAALGALTSLLDSGVYSREDLLLYAAAMDVNADNIGLVGLASNGLAFQPVGT